MKVREGEAMEKNLRNFYQQKADVPEGFSRRVMDQVYQAQEAKKNEKPFLWVRFRKQMSLLAASAAVLAVTILFFHFPSVRMGQDTIEHQLFYEGNILDEVQVSGDFNQWQAQKMSFDGKRWVLNLQIKPNQMYQYVLIVNGRIKKDDRSALLTQDYFGQTNSTLMVMK